MSYNDQEFEDLSSEIMVLKELNQKFAQRLELKENEIVTLCFRNNIRMSREK